MRRSLAALAVLALGLAACGDTTPEPEVSTAPTDDDVTDGSQDSEPEQGPEPEQEEEEASTDADDLVDAGADEDADDTEATAEDDGGESPTPDPAALEQPCADHEDREGEAFIELVSPVDDQQVGDEFELVGCASVYEGTVRYRLLDGDGETLLDEFTTAECGGPCIGEFRETVSVEVAEGEPVVHVQVFWDDAADGSERDLIERVVVR